MSQKKEIPDGWQTLSDQELIACRKAYEALSEQLHRTKATPEEQVRLRLAHWILRTGLETGKADLVLWDRVSHRETTAPDRARTVAGKDRE